MRKLIFALIVLCANAVSAQYFVTDTVKLNAAYAELQKNPAGKSAQKAYFDAFPGAWPDFVETFFTIVNLDYTPGAGFQAVPMAEKKCEALAALTEIPDSTYCAKVVNMAVGGVDGAPGYLMKEIQHKVMNSPRREAMLQAITSMMNGDRFIYWALYWSHFLNKKTKADEYKELDAWMRANGYADEANLMKVAFDNFNGKSNFDNFMHVGQRQYEGKC